VYTRAMKYLASVSFAFAPALLLACSSGNSTVDATSSSGGGSTSTATATTSAGTGGAGGAPACTQTTFGGSRPVALHVPSTYKCDTPAPLLIMLHGYSATGAEEELYLDITAQSDQRGFLYAHPDGTKDATGLEFWNATNACCNLYGSTVDDSSYLEGLIQDIEGAYNVDRKRVYFVGHSNGAFMSYRMACDHAGDIAAIASLAGAMWEDVTMCNPSEPVATLEIHGTADTVIIYNGGFIGTNMYPPVTTTVSDWVAFNKCNATADTSLPPLTLDVSLPPDQTSVTQYNGCANGTTSELWTIAGGGHIPDLSPTFTPDVIDWLYTQQKP
jgi:polyhydroxybutyrate depolymerase